MRISISWLLEVDLLFQQVEIYDQIWFVREKETKNGKHSAKGIELVEAFIKQLREIPEGDSECFPYELIDQLEAEWHKN